MTLLDDARLLAALSLRSLVQHRGKTLIVGGLLAGGTFLLVLGASLLADVEASMERSITGSLVGNVQLVSDQGEDALAFYGPQAGSQQELGVLQDWPRTRDAVRAIDGVIDVVPMGRDVGSIVGGNELDEQVEALRRAVQAADPARVRVLSARVRQLCRLLQEQYEKKRAVSRDPAADGGARTLGARAASEEFWAGFEQDPVAAIDWLDQQVVTLEADAQRIMLPYVGTDLSRFAAAFPGFYVVKGRTVPEGTRGFLFNHALYEDFLKNKVAHEIDEMEKARRLEGRRIAGDAKLEARQLKLRGMGRRITRELDPLAAAEVTERLGALLPGTPAELTPRVDAFLAVDDATFDGRYAFFYEVIAPRIRLYKIAIGDTLTIRALSKSGYLQSVNVEVFGTYQFKGLEGSMIASRYNLMDLMTYRALYGLMTPERRRELAAIKASVGVREIARADAEDALFGAGADEAATTAQEGTPAPQLAEPTLQRRDPAAAAIFDPAELDGGVVPHAAVVLRESGALRRVEREIRAVSAANGLGLKTIDWQDASGIVGQFILVLRAVLTIALVIVFGVALVIINNTMVMATMDRVREIGTMRAIGASRGFVLRLLLAETVVLGLASALVGSLAAAAVVLGLGVVGIPATGEVTIFLFAGQALRPTLHLHAFLLGAAAVVVVATAGAAWPARLAAKIAPVVAMQSRE